MSEPTKSATRTRVGTLSNDEIAEMCGLGKLISSGYKQSNIQQACYELTASNIYYDLSDNKRRRELKTGEYVLVKPKQLVVVITHESLEIPNDVLGRILTKGRLFSVGLLPVNTYADPGFSGQLGVVLYNASNRYLKLPLGEPIAKIEFSRLEHPVTRAYRGQHGYQTNIWPVPENLYVSPEELRSDQRIMHPDEELERSYGPDIARVIKRVFRFERYLIISAVLYFVTTLLLMGLSNAVGWTSTLANVAVGVVSNLVFASLTWFGLNLRKK